MMQDRVYQTPVWDVANLRQRLIDTWNNLSQSIVDDAVDEWCKILQACVNKKGGHSVVQTGCVDKLDVLLVCTTKKCNLFSKVMIFATNFFCKVVQQHCIGEVGKSIIVMLQINSV